MTLQAGVADDTVVAHALDSAPKSDLLIRVEAPPELVKARLADRRRLQSTFEQLFERDLKTSLASISIIDRLHDLLLQRGRSVMCVSSLDQRSLGESVEAIAQQIIAKLATQHRGAA